MHSVFGVIRLRLGLAVIAMLGALVFGATPAVAGIGGSDVPTWPGTATVGDVINASVLITNTSTTPNNTENVQMTALFVTPACADGASSVCLGANTDPGVFKVLSATGDASTSPCAGVSFTLGVPNPSTGEVQLTPVSTVTLGAVSGGTNLSCLVNITLRVFKMPTNPAGSPGVTDPLTRAALVGLDSGLGGSAGGAAQITLSKATPGVATTSNPNTNNVAPGTSVTDSVVVTKAPGAIAPTGSVRFILCQPNEVTGAGCPLPAGTKIGADKALVGNSATSDATTNTTTGGKYCWRARYLGDDNYNRVDETDAVDECFTVVAECHITVDKTCSINGGPDLQDCVAPTGGALVTYKYAVTNTGTTDVASGTLTDKVGATTVFSTPFSNLNAGGPTQTFSTQITVDQNTENVVTVIGNPGVNQCTATDSAAVITPCVIQYPFSSANPLTSVVFNESEVLRAFQPNFAGPGGRIQLFYNDEHTLSLGVRQISVKDAGGTTVTNRPVTPMVAQAGPPVVTCVTNPLVCHVVNPQVGFKGLTGDLAGTDPTGRPVYPAIFITDLTINGPDSLAGDWQFGGQPIPPSDVYGTWKSATKLVDKTKNPTAITLTPDGDSAKNNWTLGPGSDTPAGGFASLTNQGFGAEITWNVDDLRVNLATGTGSRDPNDPTLSSLTGHSFRIQFMIHDGDQNKSGGDVGQNCMTVAIP